MGSNQQYSDLQLKYIKHLLNETSESKKTWTKCSSVSLLQFVQVFLTQTLLELNINEKFHNLKIVSAMDQKNSICPVKK